MARNQTHSNNRAAIFFVATLILWFISVLFEILFNQRTQLFWIIAGTFFFQSSNWLIRFFVSRDPLFVNTSVSLLHSTITSVSVVFIVVHQFLRDGSSGMFEHSQLVGGTWQWAYPTFCFSCGYFAYDQLDMLLYRLYSGFIPSILMHHLILLICFTLALYRDVTVNYLILTLISLFGIQLHSIFLHVRKVRRMVGIRNTESKRVKLEWVLNWATFIFARCLCHVLITIKLFRDASKFEKGVELPLALFGMAGMNFLNVGLGIDLLKAFKRERDALISNHNHHG